jgi:hypothetical protein
MAGFAIGLALITWFGLLSRFPEPTIRLMPIRFDLAEHIAAFGWMGFTGLLAWNRAWAVIAGLSLSAGLLELVQMMGSLHEASALDWTASTAGAAIGCGLALGLRRLSARRREFAMQGGRP